MLISRIISWFQTPPGGLSFSTGCPSWWAWPASVGWWWREDITPLTWFWRTLWPPDSGGSITRWPHQTTSRRGRMRTFSPRPGGSGSFIISRRTCPATSPAGSPSPFRPQWWSDWVPAGATAAAGRTRGSWWSLRGSRINRRPGDTWSSAVLERNNVLNKKYYEDWTSMFLILPH